MGGFVLPVLSGLAGMFGGGSTKTTNTNQSGTLSGGFANQSSGTPTLNPLQQQLSGLFTRGAIDQFQNGTNLAPFASAGLQGIQQQGTQNTKAIANNLASRGLSFSPAAGNATTQNQLNTGNQMQSFLQQIPLLQHQLQQGNLDQLMKAFSTMPTGTDTSSSGSNNQTATSQGTSTTSTPGGALAGLFGGVGAGLAGPSSGGGGGSILDTILGMFKPKATSPQGSSNNWYMGG